MTDAVDGIGNRERTNRSPAPAERATVAGLSVIRRRHKDLEPSRPTVILIHGAMDRAASFGRTMRRLTDLDVIAYDRRGYADSSRLPADSNDRSCSTGGSGSSIDQRGRDVIRSHALDLAEVARWSGARSVVLIGHSLGGTIAMALAALDRGELAPDSPRIISLGVFESPAPWLDGSFSSIGSGAIAVAESEGDAAGAEFFYRHMIGEATFSRLRERDRESRRSEGPALVSELRSLRDPANAIDLARVGQPVIVGKGETSGEAMRHSSELVTEALSDAWGIEIAGAGHGAHLTHPDEFAAYVRACVARGEVNAERKAAREAGHNEPGDTGSARSGTHE